MDRVTLSAEVLWQYRRFTRYNSPYAAHDEGRAIDLYPEPGTAPSPVAGEVRDVRYVDAPPKPYAADRDALLVVDTGEYLARILHVDPAVEPGDTVAVGDPLGETIRAGFFAPWVPDHLHLGFRPHGADPDRASGSLPLEAAVDVEPLSWDGTGTVVETGETWARLDSPAHPDPGEYFVGLGSGGGDVLTGKRRSGETGILDGGFPHYEHGGLLGGGDRAEIAGRRVGSVAEAGGERVAWDDVTVTANGDPVTGIALFCARDRFGIKLVGEGVDLAVGERVTVDVE
jgi:hypothetical protein